MHEALLDTPIVLQAGLHLAGKTTLVEDVARDSTGRVKYLKFSESKQLFFEAPLLGQP